MTTISSVGKPWTVVELVLFCIAVALWFAAGVCGAAYVILVAT